ncbi:hypothetical protein BKA70DRAFT_1432457 [Coprinopsis sp. MPI-PUGE-AT-0042]|nr:hypothetical protein BKA70DRAFT_1432457 [Coprinopsis sp. MPI-PUGE-AT-0042]
MVGGGELDELERALQEASGRGDVEGDVLDDDDEGGLDPRLADAISRRPREGRRSSWECWMANGAGGRPVISPSLPHVFGDEEASHQEQQPSPRETHEQDEVVEEFTFPSLSELGNVTREKRVGTPALANGEKNLSSRPRSALALLSLVAGGGSTKTGE